ncbi:GlsB/YeaQ/YmgE family stress response membrane protein [Bordetella hinzii]|nr:GlsB/YeaQ/YmgE family stress response membrane protein [Bordetella hinzii]
MSIIIMIIVGFVVGLIARALMPGDQSMGIIMTPILGIVGGGVGGGGGARACGGGGGAHPHPPPPAARGGPPPPPPAWRQKR